MGAAQTSRRLAGALRKKRWRNLFIAGATPEIGRRVPDSRLVRKAPPQLANVACHWM